MDAQGEISYIIVSSEGWGWGFGCISKGFYIYFLTVSVRYFDNGMQTSSATLLKQNTTAYVCFKGRQWKQGFQLYCITYDDFLNQEAYNSIICLLFDFCSLSVSHINNPVSYA